MSKDQKSGKNAHKSIGDLKLSYLKTENTEETHRNNTIGG